MFFLQIKIDSFSKIHELSQFIKDTLTVLTIDPTKSSQSNSLLNNTGFFTLLGAVIATFTAIAVLILKEYLDNKRNKHIKKENIFIDFTSCSYRILTAVSKSELFSSEQEFYLAMINASLVKETRDVYQFMYKDNAEKYSLAFKEYSIALSDFNKVIASYVLLTNDKNIATEINDVFADVSINLDFDYSGNDINKLRELRQRYFQKVETGRISLTNKLDNFRERVHNNLGFKL